MKLVGSSKKSYTLTIPSLNPDKNKFLDKVLKDFKNTKGLHKSEYKRARDLASFLSERFGSNNTYEREGGEISLNAALEHYQGVCKEKAATYQVMAQHLDIHSKYVRGKKVRKDKRDARHAWNKVKLGNEVYFVDVTNQVFASPHDEVASKNNLVDWKNVVVIPDYLEGKL